MPRAISCSSAAPWRDAALPGFAVFHFDGHWFERGVEMAEAIRAASGKDSLRIRRMRWWLVTMAAPFVAAFREVLEMTSLWRMRVRMDDRRLPRA